MELTLITTGIICLLAAIVGGSLKGFGIEFPALQSIPRQVLLGIFGLVLVVVSQYLSIYPPPPPLDYPPYPACLLIGEWEEQTQGNLFRFNITWNKEESQFKGTLTKQGKLSQIVGFTEGEIFYTAQLTDDLGILKEKLRWRYGSNGVSTGSEWRSTTTNINNWVTPNDGLIGGDSAIRISKSNDNCKKSNNP